MRSVLSTLTHGPIPDQAWSQATLPFSYGGLGLRSASRFASAAFISSCHSTRLLSPETIPSSLLTQDFTFPGEVTALDLLTDLLGEQPDQPSQIACQRLLDQQQFNHLKSQLDIRNQVRFLAVSGSLETSSWLKAVPLSSMGLAMLGHEYNTSIRLWLGIPTITMSPPLVCPCSATMDQFGDHACTYVCHEVPTGYNDIMP